MKSISTSFLLLLTLFAIAQAPKEKALLWKISRNGIDEPSYLYGTIHLMCPDQIKIDKYKRPRNDDQSNERYADG